jgi:hypothetical protein
MERVKMILLLLLAHGVTSFRVRDDEAAGFDGDLARQGMFRPGVGAGGMRKRGDAARRRSVRNGVSVSAARPRSYVDPTLNVDFDAYFDSEALARDGRLGLMLRRGRECRARSGAADLAADDVCAYDLHIAQFDREDGQMLAAELSDMTVGDAIVAIDGASLRKIDFRDASVRLAEAVQWRREMVAQARREAEAEVSLFHYRV